MRIFDWLLGKQRNTPEQSNDDGVSPLENKAAGSVIENKHSHDALQYTAELIAELSGSNDKRSESKKPDTTIELTPDFKDALELIEKGVTPLFITGNAGTGKSTLLKHFRRNTRKNVVVVAPTGMAALNIRGVTIHSFFKFAPKLLQEKDIRINHNKTDVFKKIDAIVIDEISMVRADILDAIDVSLRLHRGSREPFGGVQVIMFGDVCQLPPVVKGDDLENYFSSHYKSPYFFSSRAIEKTGLKTIELQKIFRQADPHFIDILNRIRRAEATIDDMTSINERCVVDREHSSRITLTTTNKSANQINQDELDKLPPPEFKSVANVTGSLDPDAYPAELNLTLKLKTQIMMLSNNGALWVNGSIGHVVGWDDCSIKVLLETGVHSVSRNKWEVIDYRYNKTEKRIEEYVLGTYEQFPVRLAWAITIHKSQGQTFENIAIDMNKGAFAHGQLYVALSRCKSLNGISMLTPVSLTDLCFDDRIQCFLNQTQAGHHFNISSSCAHGAHIHESNSTPANSNIKMSISDAISNNRAVEILYSDFNNNESTRVITPIAWVDGDKFVAYCNLRKEERHFRVSRIGRCSPK